MIIKILLKIIFKKHERELLKFIFERNYGLLGMQNYIKELNKLRKLFNCEISKDTDAEQSFNQKKAAILKPHGYA